MSPVRILFLVLTACIPGLLAGCDDAPDPEKIDVGTDPAVDQTLVFVDASASAKASDYTVGVFEDSLRQLVQDRLDEPRDRLSIFPVHQETTSKVGRWDTTNTVDIPDWSQFEQDRTSREIRFRQQINQLVESSSKEAVRHLNALRTGERFKNWTDLWGTIQVVSEEADTSARQVQVYYFSDMFESMSGEGRRNFDRRPPTSRQEAETWATEDVKTIRSRLKVRPEALQNVNIRVLPGGLATKEHADAVKYYWEQLFQKLPVRRVRYN